MHTRTEPVVTATAGGVKVEQEYFNILKQELDKSGQLATRLNCDDCKRPCGKSSEETVECLANLMTIEFLLDHS